MLSIVTPADVGHSLLYAWHCVLIMPRWLPAEHGRFWKQRRSSYWQPRLVARSPVHFRACSLRIRPKSSSNESTRSSQLIPSLPCLGRHPRPIPPTSNSDSGITRVGDTRGGNWGCHPYILSWKTWRPFLLIAVTITIAFYCFHSGVTPSRVSPHTFFTCPTSFLHYSL